MTRDLRAIPRWSGEFARQAVRVGASAVVSQQARNLIYLAIQLWLPRLYGAELGTYYFGQYHASVQIVGIYFDLALSGLFTYFSPRFAAAATKEALAADVDGAISFCLRIATPVVFAAIAFREPIIHAVYDKRFEAAISLLASSSAATCSAPSASRTRPRSCTAARAGRSS